MKTIGVLTSGGDAPGMNAAIRAVVRTALARGVETVGIRRGYAGMIAADFEPLSSRSVGGIARWGGTILQTARSLEFQTPEGFQEALENIRSYGIEGVVVIGGDGSLNGARALQNAGFPTVGVPGSIDNDLCGTDMAIGVDTATNTILEAIDKVKDTASSHERAFLIEVMGRRSGYLALAAGIAGGAEVIIVPEYPTSIDQILAEMRATRVRGKPHFIVIVAEGATPKAMEIREAMSATKTGFDARLTVLGHVQRGGSPSAADRLLATKLGSAAVDALLEGKTGVMVGIQGTQTALVPYDEVLACVRPPEEELLRLGTIIGL